MEAGGEFYFMEAMSLSSLMEDSISLSPVTLQRAFPF